MKTYSPKPQALNDRQIAIRKQANKAFRLGILFGVIATLLLVGAMLLIN